MHFFFLDDDEAWMSVIIVEGQSEKTSSNTIFDVVPRSQVMKLD